MDAITLLRTDHKAVESLFKEFEKTGERADTTRRRLVERMIEELSVHATIEEQLFYPAVRHSVPDQEGMVLESIEEHHVVKWLLSELDGRQPEDERFEPKVTVLIEMVRHHVWEEETDLFPQVRQTMGRKQLSELGDSMAEAKDVAPKHPHPRWRDTSRGNIAVGAVAGVMDKTREAVGHIIH
jgi:hemerythrin superfamily protein